MAQAKKKPATKVAAKKVATARPAGRKAAEPQYSQSVVAMAAAFAGLCVAFALFAIFGR